MALHDKDDYPRVAGIDSRCAHMPSYQWMSPADSTQPLG
jgi:hypothetical protein